jgi:hypothetical protein
VQFAAQNSVGQNLPTGGTLNATEELRLILNYKVSLY